jgi:hypothetical protein
LLAFGNDFWARSLESLALSTRMSNRWLGLVWYRYTCTGTGTGTGTGRGLVLVHFTGIGTGLTQVHLHMYRYRVDTGTPAQVEAEVWYRCTCARPVDTTFNFLGTYCCLTVQI